MASWRPETISSTYRVCPTKVVLGASEGKRREGKVARQLCDRRRWCRFQENSNHGKACKQSFLNVANISVGTMFAGARAGAPALVPFGAAWPRRPMPTCARPPPPKCRRQFNDKPEPAVLGGSRGAGAAQPTAPPCPTSARPVTGVTGPLSSPPPLCARLRAQARARAQFIPG